MAGSAAKSERRSAYRSALASSDFRTLLLSQVISVTGTWSYNVALAVFLYQRTHSAAWVAAGAMARYLVGMVASPSAGVVAERYERVRLLFGINVVLVAVQALLAAVVWSNGSPWVAVALVVVTSAVVTPYIPAVAALIPQVVPEDDLVAANALNATVDNLVLFLGPALGGLLLMLNGPGLAVAVNAASFAVAAVMTGRIRTRSVPSDVTDGGRQGPVRQAISGFRAMVSSSRVFVLVAFCSVVTAVAGFEMVVFAPLAQHQLHMGAHGYGYLIAAEGAGGVLAATFINRVAAMPRLGLVILVSLTLYTLPLAAMAWLNVGPPALALQVLRGSATFVIDTLAIIALQRSLAPEMVARVFGAFFALLPAVSAIGALAAPRLLSSVGLHTTLLGVGIAVPAAALLVLPRLLAMDDAAVARLRELAPRLEVLERIELFAAASRAALERLAATAEPVLVAAGTAVVRQGARSDALYLVEGGMLRVTVGREGRQHALATVSADGYFGEVGVLAGMPRTATVTAVTASRLLRISAEDFLSAVRELSASRALVDGATQRLAATHPGSSSEALTDLLPVQPGDRPVAPITVDVADA